MKGQAERGSALENVKNHQLPISYTATMNRFIHASIEAIQDEVRCLVEQRMISRHQPIYALFRYFPGREWQEVEQELEANDFLLRDQIGDLIGHDQWFND